MRGRLQSGHATTIPAIILMFFSNNHIPCVRPRISRAVASTRRIPVRKGVENHILLIKINIFTGESGISSFSRFCFAAQRRFWVKKLNRITERSLTRFYIILPFFYLVVGACSWPFERRLASLVELARYV